MEISRTIEVFKILLRQSNEQNPITMNMILEELGKVGIKANRKSVYNDFKLIDKQTPCEVITTKGAKASYFLSDGLFEMAEMRLLMDAIQCSKFISTSKSELLVQKFEKLVSRHDYKELSNQIAIENRNKSSNKQIFINVDTIYKAIGSNRLVTFQYFDYNWKHEQIIRKDGKEYTVYPLFLLWEDNKYYLVCYTQNKSGISHYRVDRIINIKTGIIDLSYSRNIDIAKYSKEVFSMFSSSEKREVVLAVDNSDGKMLNQIFDQFGDDIIFAPMEKEYWYKCKFIVNIAVTFFGWISYYEGKIQIIEPGDVKKQYVEFLTRNIDSIRFFDREEGE